MNPALHRLGNVVGVLTVTWQYGKDYHKGL